MRHAAVLRRGLMTAALAVSALLAACGGGDVVNQLSPTRLVVFGDAFSDQGQSGNRYTVNDGSVNNWLQQVASRYGVALTAQSAGGTAYAEGNARITAKPDAGGGSATRTVQEQVSAFLAAGAPTATDLIFIGGGFSDIIVQTVDPSLSDAQRLANVQQAAVDLAAQVRRLVAAGANYVVLTGVYDLGKTPWAVSLGSAGQAAVSNLSSKFNAALIVALDDFGKRAYFVDQANYVNFLANGPGSFGFTDSVTVACASTGSGTSGIGISAGTHVSSRLCTTGTLASGVNYATTLWADPVYPTPLAQRLIGDNAFNLIRRRF